MFIIALRIKSLDKFGNFIVLEENLAIDKWSPNIFIGTNLNVDSYYNFEIYNNSLNSLILKTIPVKGEANLFTRILRPGFSYKIKLISTLEAVEANFNINPHIYVLTKDKNGLNTEVSEKIVDVSPPIIFKMDLDPTIYANVLGSYKFVFYESNGKYVFETPYFTDKSFKAEVSKLKDRRTYFVEGFFLDTNGVETSSGKIEFYVYKDFYEPVNFHAFDLNVNIENGVIMGKTCRLIELYADGDNTKYELDREKGIRIKSGGVVTIKDENNILNADFTLQIWLDSFPTENVMIAQLYHEVDGVNDPTQHIDIWYKNKRIYAIKYSYGLASEFISMPNDINEDIFDEETDYLFILLKHQNQSIDLWAEFILQKNPKFSEFMNRGLYTGRKIGII